MQHETLTHAIIGCAMNIHKALGNGFQEIIYQRAFKRIYPDKPIYKYRENRKHQAKATDLPNIFYF